MDFVGVWESKDGGVTFSRLLDVSFAGNDAVRLGGECLAFEPSNVNVIWAGSRDGLFRSSDAGKTWSHLAPSYINTTAIASIHIHPKMKEQVWVGGDDPGLWISLDGGNSW